MTLDEIQRNLERLKKAGKELVGEELKPLPPTKKPKNVPAPGKTWTAWVREHNSPMER